MRQLCLATLVFGCGHSPEPLDQPPDATPDGMPDMSPGTCTGQMTPVYLARGGGTYKPGATDSRANTSTALGASVTFAAYDDPAWSTTLDCVTRLLAPFEIAVTETDPGTVPHVEIVLSPKDATEIGSSAQLPALYTTSGACAAQPNAIAFSTINMIVSRGSRDIRCSKSTRVSGSGCSVASMSAEKCKISSSTTFSADGAFAENESAGSGALIRNNLSPASNLTPNHLCAHTR